MLQKKRYKIIYSNDFLDDLKAITTYISRNLCNSTASMALNTAVFSAIKDRSRMPAAFERLTIGNNKIYYRIYVKNYVVYYTIDNDTISIKRILYAASDIEFSL